MPEEDAATALFSLDRTCIFSCLWMSGLNRALHLCAFGQMQSWAIVLQLHRSMHGDHTCFCYGVLR